MAKTARIREYSFGVGYRLLIKCERDIFIGSMMCVTCENFLMKDKDDQKVLCSYPKTSEIKK